MSDETTSQPGFRSKPIWTRAVELRPCDRVRVRHDNEDLWATVTAITASGHPTQLDLSLRLEREGAPVGTLRLTAAREMTYLRRVPSDCPADAVPASRSLKTDEH